MQLLNILGVTYCNSVLYQLMQKRKGRQMARKTGVKDIVEDEIKVMLHKCDIGKGDEVD
jgi:hypothetical protein